LETTFSNIEILEAIKREDSKVLRFLYEKYFPGVSGYILNNSGSEEDAKDVFQDSLVVIYLKVTESDALIIESFKNYLHSVVYFIWSKELRRRKIVRNNIEDYFEINQVDESIPEWYTRMEKRQLIIDHFNQLNDECKKLLTLFINETPIARITSIMEYKSDAYCRNRRHVCKGRLIRRIWNSPRYKELRNEKYSKSTKIPRW